MGWARGNHALAHMTATRNYIAWALIWVRHMCRRGPSYWVSRILSISRKGYHWSPCSFPRAEAGRPHPPSSPPCGTGARFALPSGTSSLGMRRGILVPPLSLALAPLLDMSAGSELCDLLVRISRYPSHDAVWRLPASPTSMPRQGRTAGVAGRVTPNRGRALATRASGGRAAGGLGRRQSGRRSWDAAKRKATSCWALE
ncbi:hypothetical protein F5X97DRAFT_14262 [Nemania serpens]|nr:hypothetical protein F5X97DRAFT_14262 [Nemania serpens]